jgi:hypothetical protein
MPQSTGPNTQYAGRGARRLRVRAARQQGARGCGAPGGRVGGGGRGVNVSPELLAPLTAPRTHSTATTQISYHIQTLLRLVRQAALSQTFAGSMRARSATTDAAAAAVAAAAAAAQQGEATLQQSLEELGAVLGLRVTKGKAPRRVARGVVPVSLPNPRPFNAPDRNPDSIHLTSRDVHAALHAASAAAARRGALVGVPQWARMPSRYQRHWLKYGAMAGGCRGCACVCVCVCVCVCLACVCPVWCVYAVYTCTPHTRTHRTHTHNVRRRLRLGPPLPLPPLAAQRQRRPGGLDAGSCGDAGGQLARPHRGAGGGPTG